MSTSSVCLTIYTIFIDIKIFHPAKIVTRKRIGIQKESRNVPSNLKEYISPTILSIFEYNSFYLFRQQIVLRTVNSLDHPILNSVGVPLQFNSPKTATFEKGDPCLELLIALNISSTCKSTCESANFNSLSPIIPKFKESYAKLRNVSYSKI